MIQSARSLKPSSQDEIPEVDFSQLQMNTLRRYKKHYKVVTKPSLNKAQLAEVIKILIFIYYIIKVLVEYVHVFDVMLNKKNRSNYFY